MLDQGTLQRVKASALDRHIGAQIRDARTTKGMSVEDVATALGCEVATLLRNETGEVRPSASRMRQIAEALGVDVTAFLITPSESATARAGQERNPTTLDGHAGGILLQPY